MNKGMLFTKELQNSATIEHQPGMTLENANGDIDTATLGYQYTIQTTSQIRSRVIKQKFYEVPFGDYIPVIPGTGAWLENIKTNVTYDVAGSFESGNMSISSGPTQVSNVDVGIAPTTQAIMTWSKGYQYSIPEVQKALASDNWDILSSKLDALKKNCDLGLQKIAFLGLISDQTNFPGLLTNTAVTNNTTTLTTNISAMSYAQFQTLISKMLSDYFSNSNSTAFPDTFAIPMDDYLGLGAFVNPQYPVADSMLLNILLKVFQKLTGNPNFTIYGLAYGTAANNAGYLNGASGYQRYVLYKNDPDVMAMDIPVQFNLTPAGTSNNFNYQGVAYMQYCGCNLFRPAEVLYYSHT
jgi:hypothetical protein